MSKEIDKTESVWHKPTLVSLAGSASADDDPNSSVHTEGVKGNESNEGQGFMGVAQPGPS